MKIKILGSGGEDFPAAFCSCDHCEAERIGAYHIIPMKAVHAPKLAIGG